MDKWPKAGFQRPSVSPAMADTVFIPYSITQCQLSTHYCMYHACLQFVRRLSSNPFYRGGLPRHTQATSDGIIEPHDFCFLSPISIISSQASQASHRQIVFPKMSFWEQTQNSVPNFVIWPRTLKHKQTKEPNTLPSTMISQMAF